MIYKRILVAVILFSIAHKSMAWGRTGHHLVAEIAFHYLDDKTKAQVKHYLGSTSIDDAATWMDDMRSNSYYNYMRQWHYIDIDKGEKFHNSPDKNAVIILNSAIKILEKRENLKDAKIKEYLMIIFHLVGDLHQPLHTGYPGDKGGNTIEITSPIYTGNLHSFWDTQILEANNITMEDCIKEYNSYTKDEIQNIQKIDVLKWMYDSRSILDEVYNFKDGKIDQAYINKNATVAKKQLLLGGLRLAAVLKEIFEIDNNTGAVAAPAIETTSIPEPVVESKPTETITIKIDEASKHIGEMVKICTKIYGAKYNETSKAPTLLNAGANYPDNPLTLVIWSDKRANFKNPPDVFYKGKEVCVTGKLELYRGKPEMIITKEEQIELTSESSIKDR